jgi:CheY-like chemotaxis protein
VLIVDGSDVTATVLHMYLRQRGYAPVVVTSAPGAVEALPTAAWIGAFLYLPTDEDERRARVAIALRLREERQVPVVLLTDDGLHEDELHGVPRLGRPLDTDALEGALRRFLPSPTNRPHRDHP